MLGKYKEVGGVRLIPDTNLIAIVENSRIVAVRRGIFLVSGHYEVWQVAKSSPRENGDFKKDVRESHSFRSCSLRSSLFDRCTVCCWSGDVVFLQGNTRNNN